MPVVGMKGTGSWSADERPKNYREVILLLYPNTKAALTAILGKLTEEPTDDPEFKIFLKGIPSQRAVVNGAQTNVDTAIELTTAGDYLKFKPGHAVMNERTLEVMWVTATASNVLTVVRGKGQVVGTAMNNGDGLLILGSHYPEGASLPSAIAYDPTVVSNYTQIFRTVVDLTRTTRNTRLRTGDPSKEGKREALELHGIEMEKAFFFGGSVEDLSAQPDRTTKGIVNFLSSNVKDFAGTVSVDTWENFLEDVFESGSSEKLCLLGNRALNVLNKVARINAVVQIAPKSDTYGMNILTWVTPFGTLQLKQHPLFSENPTFNSWGFVLDTAKLKYRPLKGSDTQYLTNRQNPGDDAQKDEYLTECGLELAFEQAHGVFKGASAAA